MSTHIIKEFLHSNIGKSMTRSLQRSLKWIAIAIVAFTTMGIVIAVLIIIALFNLVVRPLWSQGAGWVQQPQTVVEQGQRWIQDRFVQDEQQIKLLQEQVESLRKQVETQAPPLSPLLQN